jgi:hypothetical protein
MKTFVVQAVVSALAVLAGLRRRGGAVPERPRLWTIASAIGSTTTAGSTAYVGSSSLRSSLDFKST